MVRGTPRFITAHKLPPPKRKIQVVRISCQRFSSNAEVEECRGDVDDLFLFTAEVEGANGLSALTVEWEFGDGRPRLAQTIAIRDGAGSGTVRHQFEQGGHRTVRLQHDGKTIRSRSVQLTNVGLARRSEARFLLLDRQVTMVLGLLAVGSGLLALYFADDVWGQPTDYLEAILWGAILTEGAKQVAALVTKAFPGP